MSALTGSVKVIPVNEADEFMVWYSPAGFEGVVSTDAHLLDGDGELLMVYANGRNKIISTEQVNRIERSRVHQNHELYLEAVAQYEAGQ